MTLRTQKHIRTLTNGQHHWCLVCMLIMRLGLSSQLKKLQKALDTPRYISSVEHIKNITEYLRPKRKKISKETVFLYCVFLHIFCYFFKISIEFFKRAIEYYKLLVADAVADFLEHFLLDGANAFCKSNTFFG